MAQPTNENKMGVMPENKLLLNMALPMIMSMLVQACYNIVDSFFVSKLSEDALNAVSLAFPVQNLMIAVAVGTGVGINALLSRSLGQKDQRRVNSTAMNGLMLEMVSGLVFTILGLTCARMFYTVQTDIPGIIRYGTDYLTIIAGCSMGIFVSVASERLVQATGRTVYAMVIQGTGSVINLILDPLFIFVLGMGVRGAALATVFGTVVACVMSLLSIRDSRGFISIPYILRNKIRPARATFSNLVKVGYSVFFEQILMRIGFMMTAVMAAHQGTDAMAAHQGGMNIMGLSFSFGDGLQAAAVALIGRSLGEGDKELAKEYGRICRMMGGVIALCLTVIYFTGARPFFGLYFREAHIVDIGVQIMRVIIFVVVFQISQVIYMGCLRGAGDTLYTAAVSTFSVTLVRTAVSYIGGYVLGWGIIGIWLGVLGDQVSRFLFASIRFKAGKWTEIKI